MDELILDEMEHLDDFQQGYDEGYAQAEREYQDTIREMEQRIWDLQNQIDLLLRSER